MLLFTLLAFPMRVVGFLLEEMPRSFARAKSEGPEPLRKRNLLALPDFLDVA